MLLDKPLLAAGILLTAYSLTEFLVKSGSLPAFSHDQVTCSVGLCDDEQIVRQARQTLWMEGGFESALPAIERALARNPGSAGRWCDLGDALLAAGNTAGARYCFSQAQRRAPLSPPTLFRAADFHFRLEEERRTLALMKRALARGRFYDGLIFRYYRQMKAGIDEVLRLGLPREKYAAQSFFSFLLGKRATTSLRPAWDWLSHHGFANNLLLARYIDFLIETRDYSTASDVFRRHVGAKPSSDDNLIFNPGFELETTGAALDWRILPHGHASVQWSSEANGGSWALRLDFDGKANPDYHHVSQRVFVSSEPLRFRAYLRTEDLTTDQGVGFRIFDGEKLSRLDLFTETVTGTQEWTVIEERLSPPAGTRLLVVQVVRRPSYRFDNKLRGTVWLDDVTLTPQ